MRHIRKRRQKQKRKFYKQLEKLRKPTKITHKSNPLLDALNLALIEKKRIPNHMKVKNIFKSNGTSVNESFSQFNVEKEPTPNMERNNT